MSAPGSPQFEYLDGQLRPGHPTLLAEFAAASERAVREGLAELDISYGPHPRQTLDLFRTTSERRAAVAYFHGGYWQSRDKADFRFIAPPLAADGFDVGLVNYPLCPDMSVAGIVTATQPAILCLAGLTDSAPLILIGHSAGGQIAVELGMGGLNVAGIMAISGVFDLAPLIETTLNARLELDAESARAASPVHRALSGAPRAIFAVGGGETGAFQDQTRRMCEAWAAAGNEASAITVRDADHFSVLSELCRDGGGLRTALGGFA